MIGQGLEAARVLQTKALFQISFQTPMPCLFMTAETPSPLQVTQFEADIRIVEQLLDMCVGFEENRYSYDSPVWYFAARHTKIDCYEKRGKKGFLFFIGDEECGGEKNILYRNEIKKIFGDNISSDLSLNEARKPVSKKEVIISIMQLVNGMDKSTVINHWEEDAHDIVSKAISKISLKKESFIKRLSRALKK